MAWLSPSPAHLNKPLQADVSINTFKGKKKKNKILGIKSPSLQPV